MLMQNTGNPILDSLVNLVASGTVTRDVSGDNVVARVEALHAALVKLARREPDGLQRAFGNELILVDWEECERCGRG